MTGFEPGWYRRPDGVLVLARHPQNDELCKRRKYEPVEADEARAELRKQADENQERAQADREATEQRLQAEAEAREQRKIENVRRNAAQAGLQVNPPKPPQGDADGDKVAKNEAPPKP